MHSPKGMRIATSLVPTLSRRRLCRLVPLGAMTGQLSLMRRFRHFREALPLLGEVPSAHTVERGLRTRTGCRPEKTERSAAHSFPHWHSLSHGDPSVSLSLDSSPKRGAKGVDENPPPREALPLLGEVPSAHTGERGLRGRTRCRWEKTVRSADHSFPHRHSLSYGDPSVSLTLASSPKRGAKGVDSPPRSAAPLRGSSQ